MVVAGLYPGWGEAAAAPSLGTAQSFAVLAGSTVTNTGATNIIGDVGVSPGTAITGFPPGVQTGGTMHSNDAVAIQAQHDAGSAYSTLAALPCDTVETGTDLGGLTLVGGVYCFATSAQLTGTLVLDGQNQANAVFVFQIGTALNTASASAVSLINGASSCNVFWQVGSSATLGTSTSFSGNILALASISLTGGASVSGRLLAQVGAVTLIDNSVSNAGCGIPSTATPATPTDTAVPSTGTPAQTPTNTPIPGVNTATPTNTPIPGVNTATPTNTPIPGVNTATPTNTPIPAVNTQIAAINTRIATATRVPNATSTAIVISTQAGTPTSVPLVVVPVQPIVRPPVRPIFPSYPTYPTYPVYPSYPTYPVAPFVPSAPVIPQFAPVPVVPAVVQAPLTPNVSPPQAPIEVYVPPVVIPVRVLAPLTGDGGLIRHKGHDRNAEVVAFSALLFLIAIAGLIPRRAKS